MSTKLNTPFRLKQKDNILYILLNKYNYYIINYIVLSIELILLHTQ